MTEGQIKYQTLMENQRHNLALESIEAETQREANRIKRSEAEAKWADIAQKERKLVMDEGSRKWQDFETIAKGFMETGKGLSLGVGIGLGM